MSEKAPDCQHPSEMEMKRKNGAKYLLLTPGNYGADFVKENTKFDVESLMKCSNYVGETLDMAVELGISGRAVCGTTSGNSSRFPAAL